ncbi:cytochrome b5 [[Candida] jaroonii]|uniref:Cytochrome b5 n=1 Tax=[Candida] jaroonii TaxID=467808 RepID=A0ACA9Y789_9ASCO|nr:cytochrome b5 [[Candida] jaroonii]
MTIERDKNRPNKFFTFEDVNKHFSHDDLWIIVYNKVYDVSSFIKEELHPGGAEVIIEFGGSDATEAFDDVAHSNDAYEMLEPYYIGDIVVNQQRHYHSNRKMLMEAEEKMKRLKQEKIQRAKEWKRQQQLKKMMENLTILLLLLLAFCTILFYFLLQSFKRNYYGDFFQ